MSIRTTAEAVKETLEESIERVAESDLAPQVEAAVERALDLVGDAVEQVEDFLEDTAAPALADASDRVREGAHTFAVEKAAPAVAAGAAVAAEQALHVQERAEELAATADTSSGRRRTRWVFLAVAGVAGVVAATLVRRRMNHPPTDDWTSTYPRPVHDPDHPEESDRAADVEADIDGDD